MAQGNLFGFFLELPDQVHDDRRRNAGIQQDGAQFLFLHTARVLEFSFHEPPPGNLHFAAADVFIQRHVKFFNQVGPVVSQLMDDARQNERSARERNSNPVVAWEPSIRLLEQMASIVQYQ